MNKLSFIVIFIVFLFVISITVQAQEKISWIGLGVGLNNLASFDYPSFYLPINISAKFRLEPEIWFYRYSETGNIFEETQTNLSLGLGVFFVVQKEKLDIYYGTRNGIIFSKTRTWSQTDFYIGPATGAEYYLHERFSLGGEIQLRYVFLGDDGGAALRINALFLIRWYF
jgi:hypothetical protein